MRNALLLLICMAAGGCSGSPRVEVGGELLRGERLQGSGVLVFRGVPFAEPPVGELRWRPPQPLATNLAERDATRFAPACMQSTRILEWYRDMAEIFGASRDVMADLEISEDCLYLNIWMPDLVEDAALPVMVYVHGGSNNSGWSYEPNYHGHALAERGVVLVSVAYRLGVFGFFSHPDLEDDGGVANFGLLDLIAALEWIRDNIAVFGGDPDRVTLFGESAGAENILALMASRRTDGLFHGAILQSTAGFGIGGADAPTLARERQRGSGTAAIFGFAGEESLSRLRAVAAGELLGRYEERYGDYYHSPAVDGVVLEDPVWDVMRAGELSGIPFIIGTNADEWLESTPVDVTADDVVEAVRSSRHLQAAEALEIARSAKDHREAIDRISTADAMLCPSHVLAAHQSGIHANAWVYYFSRVRDGEGGATVRAYHGAELPYVFGTHDPWMTTTDTDRRLSEQMMAYWIRFSASGDPNGDGAPGWPVYAEPGLGVMEFTDEPRVIPSPEPDLCRIFNDSVGRD